MTGALWLGPILALLIVGLLALLLRWAFGGPRISGPSPDGKTGDFGLLRPVAEVKTTAEANVLRALLSDGEIRSTTVTAPGGRLQVMVFAVDIEKAKRLVGQA